MADSSIDAAGLRAAIRAGGELALLDVREAQDFVAGHILTASHAPLSRLELVTPRLVPRGGTRVLLCDGGDGVCDVAAERLVALGYRDVSTLKGGAPAWAAAGHVLFEGSNVPCKAFGEIVELTCHTPALDAEVVKERVDRGDNLIILDGRPWDEYQDFNIPGGIDCPNAELAYRVRDLAPDPETTIVVNCAGRTRSIIGAQTLLNAGVENPVYALRNGTIGWEWAGLPLEHGASRRHSQPSADALAWSRKQCAALAERTGVTVIDEAMLDAWRAERDDTTLYIFDVREPEEFSEGSLVDAISAQGTQLVQATDEYAAVRDARFVLVDDTGVRSRMTASWLKQLGHPHVAVLDVDVRDHAVINEVAPPDGVALVTAQQAAEEGHALLDLSSSLTFRAGHPKGALWGLRSRLEYLLANLGSGKPVAILDDEHGHLAALAVKDLAAHGLQAAVLQGGLGAWCAAGLPVASGPEGMTTTTLDTLDLPFDLAGDPKAAKRAYIDWELQLPEQIRQDGLLAFSPLNAR